MRTILLVLILACSFPGSLSARVQLTGDRVSLSLDREPLLMFLRAFAQRGVRVVIDPEIDGRLTGEYENEKLDDVLNELLAPLGYALVWDIVDGPVGPWPRLAELQVFRPDHTKKLQLLVPFSGIFDVVQSIDGSGPGFIRDEILLGVKPGTSLEAFKHLLFQIGGTIVESVPKLGIYQVRLAPGTNVEALVQQLEMHPIVAEVEPNYVVKAPEMEIEPAPGSAPMDPVVVAPAKDGAPVAAVLDSGLISESGLGDLVVGAFDAVNPEQALSDTLGHGTQMAYIVTGAVNPEDDPRETSRGGVPLVAIRSFDENGNATNFSLIQSMMLALNHGAKVINLSWGSEVDSGFVSSCVAYAQNKGAIVVASVGNEPTGQPVYPAAYKDVVAVSALGESGQLWDRSNFGSFTSMAAPGAARFPVGYQGPPGTYRGTSISSAYVTRVLALYMAANPEMKTDQVIEEVTMKLTDLGPKGKDSQFGYGALDREAVNRLLGAP